MGNKDVYARLALTSIPRLLGTLDRESHSRTWGSFDRDHWGWKFRDFPITMLQAAMYPLALLWRYQFIENPYYQNTAVSNWLQSAVEYTCKLQHRNGSFDSYAPSTQDHGVSLAMAFFLSETRQLLQAELSPELDERVRQVVRSSCDFGLKTSEDHAFISNHHALFALAFLNAKALLGDDKYLARAQEIIELILREQSPDGWYREYGGPDPGYESLGIFYLALYWQRTRSRPLLDSLRRAIEFYAWCVHPDGSVGGVYGSRHTQLYFPGGFELLAAEIPMAATIAEFMRERLERGNVLTPTASDVENVSPLLSSYLLAYLALQPDRLRRLPLLPCETFKGLQHFTESNITFAGNERYYAVTNLSKGGVCRIFDKHTQQLVFEDAGYLVRAAKSLWTSQRIGVGRRMNVAPVNQVACETHFCQVNQEVLSPAKFLLMRLLNLTLFRNLTFGAWIRHMVVARLITQKRIGPIRLARRITFGEDKITFYDRLFLDALLRVESVSLPRAFTAIHMGSSKYFHPAELNSISRVNPAGMAQALNYNLEAECTFSLHFSDSQNTWRANSPEEVLSHA